MEIQFSIYDAFTMIEDLLLFKHKYIRVLVLLLPLDA